MSSRRRRSSQSIPIILILAVLVAAWYVGLIGIPGVPSPSGGMPDLKGLLTAIPDSKEISTLLPSLPSLGQTASSTEAAPSTGGLPNLATKPEPKEITFQGCPPEGDGGDLQLNKLKNRVDEGQYTSVSFDAIASLKWPKAVQQRDRADWSSEDTAAIAKYEGIPVMLEGYLAAATESGPESTNCHGTDHEFVDWHVSLVKNPGEDRSHAIVTETTPRVRPDHKWTLAMLGDIIDKQERIRISGWLFFDPEHPDHLGKYRITLWEVHPIMQMEVYRDGRWIPLDDLAK